LVWCKYDPRESKNHPANSLYGNDDVNRCKYTNFFTKCWQEYIFSSFFFFSLYLLLFYSVKSTRVVFSRLYTAVLWVCIRTFFTLPFRDRVGDVPLKPGFCMPRPPTPPPVPFPLADRGFFRLDRNGLRITGVIDEPFELSVVVIDIVLPLVVPLKYGFPLASVTDILPLPPTPTPPPPPENI